MIRKFKIWLKGVFCQHKSVSFNACTGVIPKIDGVNAEIGISVICNHCGKSWVGDVVGGLPDKWRKITA